MRENDDRDERQKIVYRWVQRTFGVNNAAPLERVRRLIEEAVELAQAEGASEEQVLEIVEHVYGKPAGEVRQEVGGVGLSLLGYCQSRGISADDAERDELISVLNKPASHFRARHNIKADAGIALRCQ